MVCCALLALLLALLLAPTRAGPTTPSSAAACERPDTIRGVRLAGGKSSREGRLEVEAGCAGQPFKWFPVVCQTSVPYRDGNDPGVDRDLLPQVVCRQLGFGGGVQKLFKQTPQTGPVLTGPLLCNGTERAVGECRFHGFYDAPAGYCNPGDQWEDMGQPYEVGIVCSGAVPRKLITGVKLEGGPSAREGRLLVQIDGTWGAVCNKNVSDIVAAQAACKQLGFAGAAAARGAAFYGASRAPMLLQIVSCPGSKDGLESCLLSRSVDSKNCTPADGFGVWCTGKPAITQVRLVGGLTPQDGRVEVKVGNQPWGSVCANIPFDDTKRQDMWTHVRAARVARSVCRSLGYQGGAPQGPIYGPAPKLALTNLACTGRGRSLSVCSFTRPSVACQYEPKWVEWDRDSNATSNYLSVACTGARPQVRLAGGASPREGRVEVQASGQWRPLCDTAPAYVPIWEGQDGDGDYFADQPTKGAGRTICRYLGFAGGGERYGSFYGKSSLPALASISCTGREHNPLACVLDSPSGYDTPCDQLGVACAGAPGDISAVRLVNGSTPREGRLEVQLGGTWGGIAADDWQQGRPSMLALARTACAELGYGGGVLRFGYSSGFYGPSPLPAVLTLSSCPGLGRPRARVADCAFGRGTPPDPSVGPNYLVSVACNGSGTVPEVRLANGTTSKEGRVEVRLSDGRWGTMSVADVPFSGAADSASLEARNAAARVICRQLSMSGGTVRGGSYYGSGAVPAVLGNADCRGDEAALEGCSFDADAVDANYDVFGVACNSSKSILGLRLMNGSQPSRSAGRVEVQLAGRGWGTVSPDRRSTWYADPNAVELICRLLGFKGGSEPDYSSGPDVGRKYGASTWPIKMTDLECPANATSFEECSFSFGGTSDWGVLEAECTN